MTPDAVVREFCRAVERRDVAALVDFFTDDAVYHNIPLAPLTGREAIASTLEQFIGPASFVEFVPFELSQPSVAGSEALRNRR